MNDNYILGTMFQKALNVVPIFEIINWHLFIVEIFALPLPWMFFLHFIIYWCNTSLIQQKSWLIQESKCCIFSFLKPWKS